MATWKVAEGEISLLWILVLLRWHGWFSLIAGAGVQARPGGLIRLRHLDLRNELAMIHTAPDAPQSGTPQRA